MLTGLLSSAPNGTALKHQLQPTLAPLDTARQLPAWTFLDASALEWERKALFARAPRFVGTLADWASHSILVRTWSDASVIVTTDGESLKSMSNHCRHRGSRLLDDGSHDLELIRCPYHAWGYRRDGTLRFAPHTELISDFDASEHGLHNLETETLAGLVFCHPVPGMSPVQQELAELHDLLNRYRLAAARRVAVRRYDVAANWKVVVQNYLECYHCPSAHPTFCQVLDWGRGGRLVNTGRVVAGYLDLLGESETASVGGRITNRALLGDLTADDRRRVYSIFMAPNCIVSLHPDYMLIYQLDPLEPGRTAVLCDWHAIPTHDGAHEDIVDFWDEVLREDWSLCESVQLGMAERSYTPGPYTLLELDVHAFDRWVAEQYLS